MRPQLSVASTAMPSDIISVHKFRRVARSRERELQAQLDVAIEIGGKTLEQELRTYGLPSWTRGVKVEKAGPFQHAVVATRERGH